jgi:hypothetical protein
MLFIEWWLVGRFAILIAVIIATCASWWLIRNRRKSIRVAVIILSSPVAVLAALFLALQYSALGCLSYSSPLYSPDKRQAVRVRTSDGGATGGESSVELFWNHGFSSKDVYWGEWKSVDIKDLKWENDSTLDVRHGLPMYFCGSSPRVKVNCLERPVLSAPPNVQ